MDVRQAGRLGGYARARKLSKKRRSEIAKKAVSVREHYKANRNKDGQK